MIRIAAATLRSRWVGFAGSALALALGVALVTATLLGLAAVLDRGEGTWFTRADAVVTGPDTLRTGRGPGVPLVAAPDVPPALATRLADLDGVLAAVPDRRSPVTVGGQPFTARPWATAEFGAGRLVTGRAPAAAGEIVLPAGTGTPVGATADARTVTGPRPLTVTGLVDGAAAVAFVPDAVAADWAGGRTTAVVLRLAPGAAAGVASAVGDAGLVRTGPDRAGAEPEPGGPLRALGVTLLGNAAAIAVLAAAFVVAGTFSYSVAQRRRELALLRTCGATPRQVRRTVRAEALLLGVLATAAGTVAGTAGAPAITGGMAAAGLAPAGLVVHPQPLPVAAAALVGMAAAVLGAQAAARQAGSVRALEAMREADTEGWRPGRLRWVGAALFAVTAAGVAPLALGARGGAGSAYLLLVTIALLLAVALLVPVLVPPLLAPLGAVLRRGTARIACANVRGRLRATTSTVSPVLLTVGLATATLTSTATLAATTAAAERERVAAPVVVEAAGPVGLTPALLAALAALPGVAAVEPVATATAFAPAAGGVAQVAVAHAGPGIGRALRLPVVAGTLAGLARPDAVVLGDRFARDHGWNVGGRAELWAGDGTALHPVVTAVVAEAALGGAVALLPAGPRPDTAYVLPVAGAGDADVLTAAGPPVAAHGATAGATADVLAAHSRRDEEIDRLAVQSVIGLTVTYTAISIATTFLMSTAQRRRELRAFRLAGATPGGLAAILVTEAGLVVGAGAVLAAFVTGAVLVLTAVAAGPGVRIVVPWLPVTAVAAGCALVAMVAALAPMARASRGVAEPD